MANRPNDPKGPEELTMLAERRKLLIEIMLEGRDKVHEGPGATHSHDFLYDKNGLPA